MKDQIILTILTLFLILFLPLNQSVAEITVDIQQNEKQISIRNEYFATLIDYSSDIRIRQFSNPKQIFLWPRVQTGDTLPVEPGISLVLFKDLSLSPKNIIEMPNEYTASQEVIDATRTVVTIESTKPAQVSVQSRIELLANRSDLRMQISIQNESDKEITFYPTERSTLNTEFGESNMSDLNFYFYTPLSGGINGLKILQKDPNNNPFKVDEEKNILIAQNKSVIAEAQLTSASTNTSTSVGNWFALHNGHTGRICTFEYQYPDKKPEPVQDNLLIYFNGAGEVEVNGEKIRKGFEAEKYMQAAFTFGKITLAPGETFTYEKIICTTTTRGPIYQVQDGIPYHVPLDVMYSELGFIVIASFGVPQEGLIGVEFYDEQGKKLKANFPSLTMNFQAENKRPGYALTEFPTLLQHEIWFNTDEEDFMHGDQEVVSKIKTVRLYLTDFSRNQIQMIDESHAPWRTYVAPTAEEIPSATDVNSQEESE